MYARLLAAFCLLSVSTLSGRSQADSGDDAVVYLKTPDALAPAALLETRTELASLMRGIGIKIGWWNPGKSKSGATDTGASLIVADFTGTCSTPSLENTASFGAIVDAGTLAPLAETSIVDGRILPFAHVDCSALARFVGPLLARQPEAQREHMYGRAIGRLLAHEVYHILAHTTEHSASGVAKEHFSTTDLLSERFEFESAAIAPHHIPPLMAIRTIVQ